MEGFAITFHSSIIFSCLVYYFRLSKTGEVLIDQVCNQIVKTKSSITGEISEHFTKLLTPVPNVYIVNSDNGDVKYNEGTPNPAKTENFRNWLDDYLARHNTFFISYYQIRQLYKKWVFLWSLLKYFVLSLALIEIPLVLFTIYWSNICPKEMKQNSNLPMFCGGVGENESYTFLSIALSSVLIFIGLIILLFTEIISSKLIKIKDRDARF